MAIEIVTENHTTHDQETLEQNAKRIIIDALNDYDAESWDTALIKNIIDTLNNQK